MQQSCRMVLGLDLEGVNEDLINSGVNTNVDRVIEIGAVLWDCEKLQPVKMISELVKEDDHLPITQELTDLTGIDSEMLEDWALKGEEIKQVLIKLSELIDQADAIMAHNGEQYDKPMIEALYRRFHFNIPEKTWIDTIHHVEYPAKIFGKSMPLLEHAHGFINPFPHRAVTDVLSMLKIASNYDFNRMLKLAQSQKVRLVAALDAPNWKNKQEVEEFNKIKNRVAKSRFRWDGQKKVWTKEVPKLLVDEGKIDYDFDYYMQEINDS